VKITSLLKDKKKERRNIFNFLEASRMKFSMSVVNSSKIAKINNKSKCVSKKFNKKVSFKNSFICGNYFGGYCCCDKMTMGILFRTHQTM
jgi:hypothetical protein